MNHVWTSIKQRVWNDEGVTINDDENDHHEDEDQQSEIVVPIQSNQENC